GSGTLLMEAAGWAGRRAPGLDRKHFGFERWGSFDAGAAQRFADLKAEARAHAARAGFALQGRCLPLSELQPRSAPGALLMNPPYGQRLHRSRELEQDIARLLERFRDHQCALIVPVDFPVQRAASRWLSVFNGALECEFRRYDAVPQQATARSTPAE